MAYGVHWFDLFPLLVLFVLSLMPIIVGFAWVRPDADRRGQPGVIWAILTIPLGWLTVLVYLVVRALMPSSRVS